MSQTPVPVEPDPPTTPALSPTSSHEATTQEVPHSGRTRRLRWLLPLVVLAAAFLIITLLFVTGPEPKRTQPVAPVPYVQVTEVEPQRFQLTVVAHGTVEPRTESDLVAEVRGRVVEVAPALEAGGFFEAGETLLRLDGRDYRIAVERNRASVQLAESEDRLAKAEAQRRRQLVERGVASDADLEQFENRALVAAATLAQARANLSQAVLDLERTAVSAPFAGRVRARSVDLGQFVSPGSLLAQIYAVDYSEIRLPIRTDELAFLTLPSPASGSDEPGANVSLQASLGGQQLEWMAELVRTEGAIDPRTRMMNVVARIDDPHGREADRVPLPAGLFVRAEIQGRQLDDVYVLPTAALRDGDSLYLLLEDRLVFRNVDVLRRGRDEVVIDGGLEPGDLVIVTPMRAATDGMRVRAKVGERK